MSAADIDIDQLLAALPAPDPRQMWDELQAARRAAETAPPPEPSIIPTPEHVYPPGHRWWWRFLAFPCAHRCGWAHLEDLLLNDLEDAARPFVISARTPAEMTQAITARADARAEAQRQRIEDAVRQHLRTDHSDHEVVGTLGSTPWPSHPSTGPGKAPPFSPPTAGPIHARGAS
ncbi:hypothetical protein [Streptomyces sp. NPDC088847]|uniref:hypothetical protein n=1 Tax=Streptomyces sp. NPDC088847 TaxID=3365909 RepID=UPI0038246427